MKSRKPKMTKDRLKIPHGCDDSPLDYVRKFDELNQFKAAHYVWRFSE